MISQHDNPPLPKNLTLLSNRDQLQVINAKRRSRTTCSDWIESKSALEAQKATLQEYVDKTEKRNAELSLTIDMLKTKNNESQAIIRIYYKHALQNIEK